MKNKILLPFKKILNFIQNFPEVAGAIPALAISLYVTINLVINLPDRSLSNLIFASFIIFLCTFILFWFAFTLLFGQKKQEELTQNALTSELEVLITQSLIENGSITKAEEMIKL
jgi:hypothetical protein